MKLQDLLSAYETARAAGESITPEDLCRDHPDLLPEIKLHLRAMKDFAPPTTLTVSLNAPSAFADETATRYTVLSAYARGGLGEVYRARDENLGREVALKVMLGPGEEHRRRRFEREANITGQLQHPGIVPVYGTGVDDRGRPCHVMRFVSGPTLAEAIEEFQKSKSPLTRQNPAFRQLLSRLVQVSQTIAFAHSRGIVHRDLKPSNIILGDYGETIVIDWGLAKEANETTESSRGFDAPVAVKLNPAVNPERTVEWSDARESVGPRGSTAGSTDPDILTHAGAIVGTPAYLSPEQARGDEVSPATDIFALGGLLYTLLTGTAPYGGLTTPELLSRSASGAVPAASSHRADVPPALVAVAQKAMAPAPADRFASALAFASELDHWLADEPLTAVADPFGVRLRRWTRRHRLLVSSSIAALLVAAVGLAIAAGLLSSKNTELQEAVTRAETNEVAANQATVLAQMRELEAKANLTTALQAVGNFTTKIQGDPRFKAYDLESLSQELLSAAAKFYQQLLSNRPEDLPLKQLLARTHGELGNIRLEIGNFKQAEADYRQSLADPTGDFNTTLDCQLGLGRTLRYMDDLKGSLAAFECARTTSQLIDKQTPTSPLRRIQLAQIETEFAIAHSLLQGVSAETLKTFNRAMELAKTIIEQTPNEPTIWIIYPRLLMELGAALNRSGEFAEAEKHWLTAYNYQKNLPTQAIDRGNFLKLNRAQLCNNLGDLCRLQGRWDDALRHYSEAASLVTVLFSRHRTHFEYYRCQNTAAIGLMHCRMHALAPAAAEKELRELIATHADACRRLPADSTTAKRFIDLLTHECAALAIVQVKQRRSGEAAATLLDALKNVRETSLNLDLIRTLFLAWTLVNRDVRSAEGLEKCKSLLTALSTPSTNAGIQALQKQAQSLSANWSRE
ncbi:hypothetical protein BH11PLA2_BH11PLA2_17380 [soil metagenome]